ncbi:MAG: phosphatase PAP2 family protein, partial [Rikenellaceae bacterium]|nr:phosphatase PAP2 family protein [Rikenellaceae bacterium]
DHSLILALNCDGGALWDTFFWYVSGKWEWIPLYLLILWLIYRRTGWRAMLLALGFMAAGVVVGDQIANFFKSEHAGWLSWLTPRLRPSHTLGLQESIHTVRGYAGGLYGTVSAHAATAFCIAVFSACALRSRLFTALILLWTLLVCYSRIYLGVHFPLDLLYGAVDGTLMGLLGFWGWRAVRKRFAL